MEGMEIEKAISNRIVHIDLKGAPPKIDYLLRIIPLLRQWGATGMLFEYEDMFPFSDDLSCISRCYAYTSEDIKSIQEICKSEGIIFIPLLQSFGHLEYVLKHDSFKHLRELSNNPMALCPMNKESLNFVIKVVEQYMEEHEDLDYIHIGGDEVFCLGACKECISFQSKNSLSQLYLHHMSPLIKYIHEKWPHLKIIIWDDMFRGFSTNELESLCGSVIPMVWCYFDNVFDGISVDIFKRFSDVFEDIWIASSYKGSSGPCNDSIVAQHHINNHLSWLTYIEQLETEIRKKVTGIAVTGWSRYDHFATLCELLPVSLPCLALCLEVIRNNRFDNDIHKSVSTRLGFSKLIPITPIDSNCDEACGNFPGSEIASYLQHIEMAKKQWRLAQERIDGWMDNWHVDIKREFNLCHLHYAITVANSALQIFTNVKCPLQECLSFHFDDETVKEFIVVKIDKKVKDIMDTIVRLKSIETLDSIRTNNR